MTNINQHVTSRELSERLKEVGVEQYSQFYWASYFQYENNEGGGLKRVEDVWQVDAWGGVNGGKNPTGKEIYSAYLSDELMELLPWRSKRMGAVNQHNLTIQKITKFDKDMYRVMYVDEDKQIYSSGSLGADTDWQPSLPEALGLMVEYLKKESII